MKQIILISILVLGLIVAGCSSSQGTSSKSSLGEQKLDATIYKSPTCGCCGLYAGYLEDKWNVNVDVNELSDASTIKKKYGVPRNLQSCHTTVIGEYFIEGHIPFEAIDKLLTEKPDIAGIAMPGMPSGSPGMPGRKTGPFVIYAVNANGSYEEFMTL